MKKRIIALVLVVVMSLLAFVGCDKTADFIDEDLNNYAAFATLDGVDFWTALKNLEIDDAAFTKSETKRIEKLKADIYNSVVNGMLKADHDKLKAGKLDGDGDVLYFVYYGEYVVNEEGKEPKKYTINFSKMDENSVSEIRLGDVEDTAFMNGLKDALDKAKDTDLKNHIYDVVIKDDITNDVKNNADVKAAAKKEATDLAEKETEKGTFTDKDGKISETLKEEWIQKKTDELIDEEVKKALKVNGESTYVISYKRALASTDEVGESKLEEETKYEILTKDHPLYETIVAYGSLGGLVSKSTEVDGKTTVQTSFEVDGWSYSNINVKWEIANLNELVRFDVTLTEDLKVTPDNNYNSEYTNLAKVSKDTVVTYHVYPVYYIDASGVDNITGADILNYYVGSNIKAGYFDAFEGAVYKEEGKADVTVDSLVDEIVKIFDTNNADLYGKDKPLHDLLAARDKAVEDGGSKPNADKQKKIDEAKAALLKAQLKLTAPYVEKISAATDVEGEKNALYTEFYENLEHASVESYNKAIVQNVQKEVWELIQKYVVVNEYPKKALKEYERLVYDDYEYQYYKSESAQKEHDTFTDYLTSTLKCSADEIPGKITEKAKEVLKPMIQIYFVSYQLKGDAGAKMVSFVQSDIEAGVYTSEEAKEAALEDAEDFYVDSAYMKNYKKEVGRRAYKQLIEQYGELNVRTAFQFNKLFSYLASAKLVKNTEHGDEHAEIEAVLTEDTWTVQFHNSLIGYTAVEPKAADSSTSTDSSDSHEGHDHD